ncbi:MAG: DNA topoisomerase, partial [Candidatus Ranarchaeia archaeon]
MATTMIITEKPSAAKRIAYALDNKGGVKEVQDRKVRYYMVQHGSDLLLIVSALGHLYGIEQAENNKTWTYPVYDYKWVPLFQISKKNLKSRDYLEVIQKLGKDATNFVSACDYDTEGSLIAYMILRHALDGKAVAQAHRMKFSTLTRQDLVNAYKNRSPSLDFPLIEAGQTRHEIDWLFGINLTRALTLALRRVKWTKKVLSTGRVQGPTLKLLVKRERQIKTFIPVPYWKIEANTCIKGKKYVLEYSVPKIPTRKEAEQVVADCRGKNGIVTAVTSKHIDIPPPFPFDLGNLQSEAYHHFHITPKQTLDSAERLYLNALISYPRTSSQKLPASLNIPLIVRKISEQNKYRKIAELVLNSGPRRPNEGPNKDPAHPAIYPTGRQPKRLSAI